LPLDLPIFTLSVATFRFSFCLSIYLFIHLLFIPFLADSSSLLFLLLFFFFFNFSSLSSHINYYPFIGSFLYPIFTLFPLSLSSLATFLNFFCVFLSSFVKSSPFLSFHLLLFSIIFFFCSQLSIFASIIFSLFILNASFTFTFTPISLSSHSSTPLSISFYSPYSGYYNIIFPLLFSSLSLISSLTAANSLLSTLFSLISVIMVFISLLLFPSSFLLGYLPVLKLFQNGLVRSSDVLPSSLSLLLLSFLPFGDFGMPSLSCPLPSAYHLSLTRRCLRWYSLHFFLNTSATIAATPGIPRFFLYF
jgi:hypothetical protein